ncbi:MAG: hypothetical protein ACFFCV_12130 [Promethearchaeota archaeon]
MQQDVEKQKEPIILSEIIIIEENPMEEGKQIEESRVVYRERLRIKKDIESI